jgi:hypothetical protein
MADTATASDVRPPKSVVYCGVCSLPPEVGTTLFVAIHPKYHT